MFPFSLSLEKKEGTRHESSETILSRVSDDIRLVPSSKLLLMRLEEKEDVQKSGSIWPQASVDLTFGHLFNLWKQHEIENQSMRLPTGSFTSSFSLRKKKGT